MKKAGIVFACKCLALALLDMFTVLILISVWQVFQHAAYIGAMFATLVVLFLVNTMALIVPHLRRIMRAGSTVSLLLVTGFYYVVHMLFTGLTHAWIPPLWYGLVAGLLFVTFVLCVFMLCRTGRAPAKARRRQEGDGTQQMQDRMVALSHAAQGLLDQLVGRQAESLQKAYADMRRHIEFATPFGRCEQPVILDMEQAILQRMERLTQLAESCRGEISEETLGPVVTGFMDLSTLLKNREKLILGEYAGGSV